MSEHQTLIGMRPVGDYVLVYIYDDGESTIDLGDGRKLVTGIRDTMFDSIHRTNLDEKHPGIRGRWAVIVGVNDQTPDCFELGDKVFLDELKWSRGVMAAQTGERVWKIPPDDILLIDQDGLTDDEANTLVMYLAAFDPELVFAALNEAENDDSDGSGTTLANWM